MMWSMVSNALDKSRKILIGTSFFIHLLIHLIKWTTSVSIRPIPSKSTVSLTLQAPHTHILHDTSKAVHFFPSLADLLIPTQNRLLREAQ